MFYFAYNVVFYRPFDIFIGGLITGFYLIDIFNFFDLSTFRTLDMRYKLSIFPEMLNFFDLSTFQTFVQTSKCSLLFNMLIVFRRFYPFITSIITGFNEYFEYFHPFDFSTQFNLYFGGLNGRIY